MKAAIGAGVDFGLDASVSALLNRKFNPMQSAVSCVFSNVLTVSIADPVDAASGFYMIHATDFILASLPSALKLERTYFSA